MLNGSLTYLTGFASIAIGVGTILVAAGQATLTFIDSQTFDWDTLSATIKSGLAFIVTGAGLLGLGRKADKNTAAVKENTAVTTQAARSRALEESAKVAIPKRNP